MKKVILAVCLVSFLLLTAMVVNAAEERNVTATFTYTKIAETMTIKLDKVFAPVISDVAKYKPWKYFVGIYDSREMAIPMSDIKSITNVSGRQTWADYVMVEVLKTNGEKVKMVVPKKGKSGMDLVWAGKSDNNRDINISVDRVLKIEF